MNTSEFIEKCKLIHGDKYDYSDTIYNGCYEYVEILCYIHGKFKQLPNSHMSGKGCQKCGINKRTNAITLNEKDFIERCKKANDNKYDYTITHYINQSSKIKFICKTHGIVEQYATHHLKGIGCPFCSGKITKNIFIERSNKIHNFKYDYSLVNYKNNTTKVKIICPVHGIFEQIPKHHMNGCGCRYCNESKGEKTISQKLNILNIKYSKQKTFKDCKSEKKLLQFDFYLPIFNICIEYDGIQHFQPIERFGGKEGFIKRLKYDNIKTTYCEKNNIKLLRIKYNEDISTKLIDFLNGIQPNQFKTKDSEYSGQGIQRDSEKSYKGLSR